MNIKVALVLAFSLFTAALRAEKISLVGATVINPADGKVLPNATVVINGDKIDRVRWETGRCHARETDRLRRQIHFAGVHRHARSLLSIG